MKRKDLFREGFKSVFQFAFEKTDDLTETIREVWSEEKKQEKKKKNKEKLPPKKRKAVTKRKSRLFKTLSLPPGATKDFFNLCTGCNECVFACPYTALFPVTPEKENKTFPFLDPNAKSCHLCSDWPCIAVCPENALVGYDVSETKPKFGKAKGIYDHCINQKTGNKTCEACFSACPVEKTVNFRGNLPIFSSSSCTGCGLCVEVCPSFPKAIRIDVLNHNNFD
ncbi:4Fe-4S dicluster domain-containing protein [Leptospira idonii]|uniref:4Fe-4S dicluster domain-containing protein n=1 Tax=Leptospira idonii TaxID=1193500 RepID=A0A4R9M1T4_9LEPT|nr:4Fe-4S dicluster domain-containing protein [Leptospira idonii]